MRSSSFLAPLFLAATVAAQAVEEGIAPESPPPEGCETSVEGNFTIGTLKIESHKSRRETAQEAADGALFCTLKDGILKDQYGRIGSVVANRQFQFDGPPQAGAIYTGGFSVCGNSSLAIGGTTRWWQCSSGPFYNLYDEWIGGQCEEIRIQVGLLSEPSASSPAPASATSSTISGTISTVSATETGLTTSHSGSGTPSSATSIGSLSPTRSSTTGSASSSSSITTPAAAPPANTGSASSVHSSRGAVFAVLMGIFGIAFGV